MNNSPIKATLLPYSEAPHHLQNWTNGFKFKSPTTMRVAVASNEKRAIVSVCYMKINDAFLITAMDIDPKASDYEKKEAGNGIDILLEQQAQLAGVTKLLMVESPRSNECKEVRTYTHRIASAAQLQAPTRAVYVN